MTAAIPQINFSWDFLKTFQFDPIQSIQEWQSITRLIQKAEQAIKPHISEYQTWEDRWGRRLGPLCGSQTNINWSNFRPLRLSREEDWSDWLAWLLETSRTGFLADALFAEQMNCQIETFISPNVEREVAAEGRRADIVITWQSKRMTHVEVKIWDENLDKTFETAQKLHKTAPDRDWNNFILIASQSQEPWNEVARRHDKGETVVTSILWDDVVRALRRCLWHERESIIWRAWAWVFCSVIENRVLGLEKIGRDCKDPKMQMVLRWLSVLKINPEEI